MYKLQLLFLLLLDPVFANFICSMLPFLNHIGSQGDDLPGHSHSHVHIRSPHLTNVSVVMFLPYNKSRISPFPTHLHRKVLSRHSSSYTSIINILCWAWVNVVLHTKPGVTAFAPLHPFCRTCDLPCHMQCHDNLPSV